MITVVNEFDNLTSQLAKQIIDGLSEKVNLSPTQRKYKTKDDDIVFNITQISEYLNVSSKWIYEQTHLKTIPHYKMGNKQLRFRKKEIDRWLDGQKVPPAGNPKGNAMFKKTTGKD